MPEVAADIDPYRNLQAPGYLRCPTQSREQTIFEQITSNGYRVRLIAAEPLAPIEVSHIGGRYQFLQEIAKNDPRAVCPNPHEPLDKQVEPEEQVFAPRLFEITGAWFDETTDKIPLKVMLVVTKVKDFDQIKKNYSTDLKSKGLTEQQTLVNGLGRHKVHFNKLCPEYYATNSNGPAIQANHLGFPIVGHPEKFVSVHIPFLKPSYKGYSQDYGKYAVLDDIVANLANSLEALSEHEELGGLSVIQTSGIASLPSGQKQIDSIDLFIQVERVEKTRNSSGKVVATAKPYKISETSQSYLRDEYGKPLFISDIRKLPNSDQSLDLGVYRITKTPTWAKWIDFYQKENEEAEFGVPSKKLTGSGDEVEIVAVPQYIGEPVNPQVGVWDPRLGLTHAQQMRNYMMVLANCRRRQPTGTDIFLMEDDRPDLRGSLTGSRLVATNPGSCPGAHFPDSPSDKGIPCRSALFRFKVKDTKQAVRERTLWGTTIKPVTHRDYKATFVATTHMLRSDSGKFGVVHPVTGDVLLDLNFARPHVITEKNIWSSALYNFSMAATLAAVIGYWSERGTVFTTQRQTISGMDSGGLPLGSIAGDEFTRTFIEVEGNSKKIRDGEVFVSKVCRIHTGDYSDDARAALYSGENKFREYTQDELKKYKDEHNNTLPPDWMPDINGSYDEYVLKETWVEALQAFIPLWHVNKSHGFKNADVAAVMQRMSQYINLPTFYGDVVRAKKGGPILEPDQVPTIKDKSGNLTKVKSHAVGYFFHMSAEDYERIGVAMKREMRMAELNMRVILKFLGIEIDRKEGGHEWQGEGEYMPVDEIGRYNPFALKVETTNRGETTFQFVNRWIGSFNLDTFNYYQGLLKGQRNKYHQTDVGKVNLDYVDGGGDQDNNIADIPLDPNEDIQFYRARISEIKDQIWDTNYCQQIMGVTVSTLAQIQEIEHQVSQDLTIPPIERANKVHAINLLVQEFRRRIQAASTQAEKLELLG